MLPMGKNGVSLRRKANPAEIIGKAGKRLHLNPSHVPKTIAAAQDNAVSRSADLSRYLTNVRPEAYPLRGDALYAIALVAPLFSCDEQRPGVFESRRFKMDARCLLDPDRLGRSVVVIFVVVADPLHCKVQGVFVAALRREV